MSISLTPINNQNNTSNVATPPLLEQSSEDVSLFDKMTDWQYKHMDADMELTETCQQASSLEKYALEILDKIKNIKDESKKQEFLKKIEDFQTAVNNKVAEEQTVYDNKRAEIGVDFNFMEGKNAANQDDYNAQTLKLALGEINSKDLDNDGIITMKEYILDEVGDPSLYKTEDEYKEAIAHAVLMFKLMDEGMGNSDHSETLDAKEFQSFYLNLDKYEGNLSFGEADGIINYDNATAFMLDIIDGTFSKETYEKTKELALAYLQ